MNGEIEREDEGEIGNIKSKEREKFRIEKGKKWERNRKKKREKAAKRNNKTKNNSDRKLFSI